MTKATERDMFLPQQQNMRSISGYKISPANPVTFRQKAGNLMTKIVSLFPALVAICDTLLSVTIFQPS
ncbi:MAG: hypothetical protein SF123_10610 [Chloroflexota bacterium]|nr:hypothetical protein [Chloroflexota bacterium]